MTQQRMSVLGLLASLQKEAKVEVAETRTLHNGTRVLILVGKLPAFPKGSRPTWYPLVIRKNQTHVEGREVEAILRHFWQYQLHLPASEPPKYSKTDKHAKTALRNK